MILILMALYIVLNTLFFPINVRVPLPHDLLALKINGKVYLFKLDNALAPRLSLFCPLDYYLYFTNSGFYSKVHQGAYLIYQLV